MEVARGSRNRGCEGHTVPCDLVVSIDRSPEDDEEEGKKHIGYVLQVVEDGSFLQRCDVLVVGRRRMRYG